MRAEIGIDEAVLAPIMAAQEAAAACDNHMTLFRYDEQFHKLLAQMASVPKAWRMAQSVKARIDRQCLRLMSTIVGRSQRAYDDHINLLECIRRGDASGAAAEMCDHVNSVLEAVEANSDSP